jgi:hypothetical protein
MLSASLVSKDIQAIKKSDVSVVSKNTHIASLSPFSGNSTTPVSFCMSKETSVYCTEEGLRSRVSEVFVFDDALEVVIPECDCSSSSGLDCSEQIGGLIGQAANL